MELTRSSNPVLSDSIFNNAARGASAERMTIDGTVNKVWLLLVLIVVSAFFTWSNPQFALVLMIPGLIGGLILGLITAFKPHLAGYTAPAYAIFEGLFLGGISMVFENMYPGIVSQAIGLTFTTFAALLLVYKSRMIAVTENFKLGVASATGGIALFYLFSMIAGFFGMNMSFMQGSSMLSIGISLVVVVVAALNLVLDFDFIEKGAENGAPKYMEWFGAFGLVVTLVWLYIEMLRLIAKLRGRD